MFRKNNVDSKKYNSDEIFIQTFTKKITQQINYFRFKRVTRKFTNYEYYHL